MNILLTLSFHSRSYNFLVLFSFIQKTYKTQGHNNEYNNKQRLFVEAHITSNRKPKAI